MSLEFRYMLPIGIVIATIAMGSGVGGTFFSPLFILGLGLSPQLAVGSGLIVEVFGFGSGVYAYVRRQLIPSAQDHCAGSRWSSRSANPVK